MCGFITKQLDIAYSEVAWQRAIGVNKGRVDKAFCKAYKAKTLLFAASPLFNGNQDMASLKNHDGTQLIPTTEDAKNGRLQKKLIRISWESLTKQYSSCIL